MHLAVRFQLIGCYFFRTSSRDFSDAVDGASVRPRSNSLNDDSSTLTRSNSSPDVSQQAAVYSLDNSIDIPEHVLKIYRADQSYKFFFIHKVRRGNDRLISNYRTVGEISLKSKVYGCTRKLMHSICATTFKVLMVIGLK